MLKNLIVYYLGTTVRVVVDSYFLMNAIYFSSSDGSADFGWNITNCGVAAGEATGVADDGGAFVPIGLWDRGILGGPRRALLGVVNLDLEGDAIIAASGSSDAGFGVETGVESRLTIGVVGGGARGFAS